MRALAVQYLKFGLVGGLATLIHAVLFVALMETAGLGPMAANVGAYAVAVFVSYFGNFRWTFGAARPEVGSFLRFCVATAAGFVLNTAAIWAIMDLYGLPYPYTLPVIAGVTPVVVFALNRAWSFRSGSPSHPED
jgi:putative flippase GtrA